MISMRSLPLQMIGLAAVTLLLSFAANALHPQGIEATRNYFAKPQHNFQTLSSEDFREYSAYPAAGEVDVVYLDARRRSLYERGHVPGAWCVPRNDPAALESALKAIEAAGMVVIYCQGGNCEDSIFTAEDLVYRNGVDASIVFIFEPGWDEWVKIKGPVREGAER